MALATNTVMACIIFNLVFFEEYCDILDTLGNRDSNIQKDTSFNIVSLFPALSIWKYPSFEATVVGRLLILKLILSFQWGKIYELISSCSCKRRTSSIGTCLSRQLTMSPIKLTQLHGGGMLV
jgi:hypothetical protein